MTMTTHRTPTATAEAFGRQLADLIAAITERFRAAGAEATAAIERGECEPAEQLCTDEEHIFDAVEAIVDRYDGRRMAQRWRPRRHARRWTSPVELASP